jgi:hypothetical protein
MWKSHVVKWTISDFLTDFVLQNSGLNKIVLVVEITGFCNIIMLILAQWLCLARICMGFESEYVQCNAPCAISSDRTFFLQRLICVGFESMHICCIIYCNRSKSFVQDLLKKSYDGSSWFVFVARFVFVASYNCIILFQQELDTDVGISISWWISTITWEYL